MNPRKCLFWCNFALELCSRLVKHSKHECKKRQKQNKKKMLQNRWAPNVHQNVSILRVIIIVNAQQNECSRAKIEINWCKHWHDQNIRIHRLTIVGTAHVHSASNCCRSLDDTRQPSGQCTTMCREPKKKDINANSKYDQKRWKFKLNYEFPVDTAG